MTMYRTTSVLALGLFLGLAPMTANAQQDTQQQDTQQQQQTQQQDQQQEQLDIDVQDDQQQAEQQPADQQQAGQQSLMVDTLIGTDVYSAAEEDETVGSIDDVLISVDGQVEGVIIGVGGWLGVGQRDVLVSMQDLSLEIRDDDLRLVMQRTREELEAEPEFRRVDEQRTGMMGTTQQGQTAQQGQMTQQDQQALNQVDQELQQANQAIQQGDGQQAQQSLEQARQHLEQVYQQAQGEQQQAIEQTNESLLQAEQAIQQDDAQQAQQSVEQARQQLQMAMQDQMQTAQPDQTQTAQQDQQDTLQQDQTAQQDTMQPQPRDGQVVFQDDNSILASTLIGTDVQVGTMDDAEDLGQISDIVVTMEGEVEGVVVGVGGFLGIGEKDVIVGMDQLEFQRTQDDQIRVSVLQTREDLEAAEGFQRPQQQQ